jgi:putative SOS response-associated peptidase YedK
MGIVGKDVANKLVAPYHDRMPVIMPKVHYEHWLDPKDADSEKCSRC